MVRSLLLPLLLLLSSAKAPSSSSLSSPSSSSSSSSSQRRRKPSSSGTARVLVVPRCWRTGGDGGGRGMGRGTAAEGRERRAAETERNGNGGIASSFSPALFPSSRRRKRRKKVSMLLLLLARSSSWRGCLGLRALLLLLVFHLALGLRAEVLWGTAPSIIPPSSFPSPPSSSPPPAVGSASAALLSSPSSPGDGGALPQPQPPQQERPQCPSSQYACKNGKCIYFQHRCNGNDECGDNSDEQSCSGCYEKAFFCAEDFFCILPSRRCDGKGDCRDGSDEKECPSCQGGSFLCKNKNCVPSTFQCDGNDDCGDASDEEGCSRNGNQSSAAAQGGVVDEQRYEGVTQWPYSSGGGGAGGSGGGGALGHGYGAGGPVMEEAKAGEGGGGQEGGSTNNNGGGGRKTSPAVVAGVTVGCALFLAAVGSFLTLVYMYHKRRRRFFATAGVAAATAAAPGPSPSIASSAAPAANAAAVVAGNRGTPTSAAASGNNPVSASSSPLSTSGRRTPRVHRQPNRSLSPIHPNELWKPPQASVSASSSSQSAAIHVGAVGGGGGGSSKTGPNGKYPYPHYHHHHHHRHPGNGSSSAGVYNYSYSRAGVSLAARGGGVGGGGGVVAAVSPRAGEMSRSPEPQMSDGSLSEEVACLLFTLDQLKAATGFFGPANLLGTGRFGNTYKGVLPDGSEIAVKRLTFRDGLRQGRAFIKQVETLGMGNDSCLVKLWGCCVEENERMLVYEYLLNGNLGDYLALDGGPNNLGIRSRNGNRRSISSGGGGHVSDAGDLVIIGAGEKQQQQQQQMGNSGGGGTVSWASRLEIALSLAKAVKCLHQLQAVGPYGIVHGALKATNVLLDESSNVKLVDYGFPLLAQEGCELGVLFRGLHDTEYLAPDYASTGRVDRGTDLYGLGILILELISGRRACDKTTVPRTEVEGQQRAIVTWARDVLQSDDVTRILDERIAPSSFHTDSVWRVAEMAVMCCEPYAANRPSLQKIIAELSSVLERCLGGSTME